MNLLAQIEFPNLERLLLFGLLFFHFLNISLNRVGDLLNHLQTLTNRCLLNVVECIGIYHFAKISDS